MKKKLPRNFLKSDSENSIKNNVLTSLRSQPQGEDLLDSLNLLVLQEGAVACKVILELLMHRDFGCEEAEHCWKGIVDHHRVMSASLARPVALSVAICDYFSLQGKGFNFPKLIEAHEFEAMHIERHFDFLTGLHNKQTLETAINLEFRRAERYRTKLSVLFLDLDSFKEINDRHGHLAGDKILQHVGNILTQNIRSFDIAARFGGDEFVILLPETDKKDALDLAERIRTEINRVFIVENQEVRLTVSGGIATYPDDAMSSNELFTCADKALYRAKHFGKNIVLLHQPENRRDNRMDIPAHLTAAQLDTEAFHLVVPPHQQQNLPAVVEDRPRRHETRPPVQTATTT